MTLPKRDKRKKNGSNIRYTGFYSADTDYINREKGKARKLRDTSWWKKKCKAGICHYCKKNVPAEELTMDHVIPISRGGVSERFNIVPACKECNNKKKYLLPVEWAEYLETLKKG